MNLKVKIIDPIGLHARPASLLVQESNKYKSEITLENFEGSTANLKSIMSVMAMAIKQNDEIIINTSGSDEKEALKGLEKVLKDNKLI